MEERKMKNYSLLDSLKKGLRINNILNKIEGGV